MSTSNNNSNANANVNDTYYPTYQRPPKVDKSVVSRISRLFPLTSCLNEAMTEIIQEDADADIDIDAERGHKRKRKRKRKRKSVHDGNDNDGTESCDNGTGNGNGNGNEIASIQSTHTNTHCSIDSNDSSDDDNDEGSRDAASITATTAPATTSTHSIINETFKETILDKCGAFMSDAFRGEEEDSLVEHNTHQDTQRQPQLSNQHERIRGREREREPPAGLLQGKLKYYNRFGSQWRIVITDAEIRPRVNINYPILKRTEPRSLVQESYERVELELRRKRLRRIGRVNDNGNEHGNEHGNENGERDEDGQGQDDGSRNGNGSDSRKDDKSDSLCQDGVIKINGDLLLLAYNDK